MRTFTLKLLRRDEVVRHYEFAADDDDEALQQAASVRHNGPVELWEGQRLIQRFEPLLGR